MNNYLEKEKEKIQKEIDRIKADTSRVSSVDTSLSRDNILIKNDELDKYNALSRMMEILNNNFSDTNNYEYLDLYEASGLERISDTDYKLLRNVSAIYEEEVNAVINRINEIIYAGRNNFINRIVNVDGANIKESDVNEYNTLLEMKDFLDKNMTIRVLPQDYLDLKNRTNLVSRNRSQDNTPPTNGNNNQPPTNLHQTELNSVVRRMNELITEGRNNTDVNDPSMLVAHAMIKKSNTDEYIALNKMLDFLNQNTVIDNLPQSYIDLKNETSLGSKIQDNSNDIESDLYKEEIAKVTSKMNEIINASKGNKDPFNPTILVARAQIKKSDTDEFLALNEMLDFLRKNKNITTLPESYITLKSKTRIDTPSRDNNNGQPIMGGSIGDAQISDLYKEEYKKISDRLNILIEQGKVSSADDPSVNINGVMIRQSNALEFNALNEMLNYLNQNKNVNTLDNDYLIQKSKTIIDKSPLYLEERQKIVNRMIELANVKDKTQDVLDEIKVLENMFAILEKDSNLQVLPQEYVDFKNKTGLGNISQGNSNDIESDLYKEESAKVIARINKLIDDGKNNTDKNDPTMIVARAQVKKSDTDEFIALNRMLEFLKNNKSITTLPEDYITLKNRTGLSNPNNNSKDASNGQPIMGGSIGDAQISDLYKKEYKKISDRLNILIEQGKVSSADDPSVNINGVMIRQSNALEFNALNEMLNYLNKNKNLTSLDSDYNFLKFKTMIDKSQLYFEERNKIKNRMEEILKSNNITEEEKNELAILKQMFDILDKNRNLQVLPQEYLDLKNKIKKGTGKGTPGKESSQLYTSEYKKIIARMNELIDLGESNTDKKNPSVKINRVMIRQSDALEFNALIEMLKILNQNRMLTELPKEYIELRDKTALKEKKKDKDTQTEDTPKKKSRFKVIAKKTCKWLNEHKKQILIALGIAALAVAVIVAFQYLIPAITAANNAAIAANSANLAAMNASNLSSITSSMVSNSTLWHSATAAEQVALHASNQGLASVVQALTGKAAVFGSNGVWTFGGTPLAELAATNVAAASTAAAEATALTAKLAAAQSAVSALSTKALTYGLTGLGLSGLGVILPNKKSKYDKYRKTINNIGKNRVYLTDDDLRNKLTEILDEIKDNKELRDSEKRDLTAQVKDVYQAYLDDQNNSQKRGAK